MYNQQKDSIPESNTCIKPFLVLEAGNSSTAYWREIWRYRELFLVLAWRDIAVRYKQTIIGISWAVIQPFITLVVFTVIFGKIASLPSEGTAPYALMVFAGLLPWILFSSSLSEASGSIVTNSNLISKIYFPRMILPMAAIVTALIDFAIGLLMLFLLLVYFQYGPGWQLLFLPFVTLLALLASLGPALWISSMNVKYRDFRYIIPFLIQFGLYITPVGFSSSVVPEQWRLLYSLNPMVGVIDGFRWCILGASSTLNLDTLILSSGVILIFLWIGISQFKRTEKTFSDVI